MTILYNSTKVYNIYKTFQKIHTILQKLYETLQHSRQLYQTIQFCSQNYTKQYTLYNTIQNSAIFYKSLKIQNFTQLFKTSYQNSTKLYNTLEFYTNLQALHNFTNISKPTQSYTIFQNHSNLIHNFTQKSFTKLYKVCFFSNNLTTLSTT